MITSSVFVVVALLALLLLMRLAKGNAPSFTNLEDLTQRIRPVDIRAFRNLIDPEEEQFLRVHLTPEEFRAVHRERLRAAEEYVACAAQNAAILLRLGEAARHSPDPAIAEAGEKLVDTAIRLRLYGFQAMAKLYLGILLPTMRITPGDIAENYERMGRLGGYVSRMQYPGKGARVSATL